MESIKTIQIEVRLVEAIVEGFQEIFNASISPDDVHIQPTRKEFKGSHTFVVFPHLKYTRKSPEESGNLLGDYLVAKSEMVSGYNTVKGFLNLEIRDDIWVQILRSIAQEEQFGFAKPDGSEVMVEYSSPNTNKPLHLGHLRNNFLGFSVSRILEAFGKKVHKVQIINDRGIHICKSMVAWKRYGNGETPESSGTKGDKLVGNYYVKFDQVYKQEIAELVDGGMDKTEAEKQAPIMLEAQQLLLKWEQKEPETYSLWETMNEWVYKGFNSTYETMGVNFDRLYYESKTFLLGKDEVLNGVEKGIFFRKEDGSIWVDLTNDGLDEKLLLRADGTSVYMTQDIGTAILRFRDFPAIGSQIYTVGNEQEYHFKVLFLILDKLGYDWAKSCYHLSYGMVDLPSGKMKSREGTVVDADDLMNEMIETAESRTRELGKIDSLSDAEAEKLFYDVGLGALKYFILKVDPKKRMMFNPEESIDFQGNTAPFIQYAYARISSILRKADQLGLTNQPFEVSNLHPNELSVIRNIYEYPEKVQLAAQEYSPSIIAQYVYDLVKEFNRFYAEVPIMNESDKNVLHMRIVFCKTVADVIKSAMYLLGINVPERM